MEGLDNKGQVMILFSLLIVAILASLSILHAQNILAGMESSRTLMVFPKNEIRNLRDIVENDVRGKFGVSKQQFDEFATELRSQINFIYAQKGVYADLIVSGSGPEDSVDHCNVRIAYLSGEVEYNETMLCRKVGCV